MKTVILVTSNALHEKLYQPELAKHFATECRPRLKGASGQVDAVIYDLPKTHRTLDIRWVKAADFPVVILTCERDLPLPKARNVSILTYPVRMDDILRALARMGVEPDGPVTPGDVVPG